MIGTTLFSDTEHQHIKTAGDAKDIVRTFSDAIKVAKSLNTAIKNMCPECIELIQKALPGQEQEQEHTTTNEHSYVMSGGLV